MTKNEILQLINDGITTKVAPFSITQVDLGNIMTEMVNLSATTFMTGTNISVSGTGLETDPFILEMTADTNTYLTEGSDISITGDGSITTPYVISFTAGTIPWSPGSSGNFSIKTDNDSTTDATDDYATAQGFNTLASGQASHAEGSGTIASSTGAHAEGVSTTANNTGAHAEGNGTLASGTASHAEGRDTTANGEGSHSEGCDTIADGDYSHSSGIFNTAHSFGERAIGTFGTNYTANSTNTFDSVDRLLNIGNGTSVSSRSDAFQILKSGEVIAPSLSQNIINSGNSRVLITKEYADINYAGGGGGETYWTSGTTGTESTTTIGNKNGDGDATGNYSTASGYGSVASGDYSHAEGTFISDFRGNLFTIASGIASHAEGQGTLAIGDNSHSEGYKTTASGQGSHAEGRETTASGNYSHAEGGHLLVMGPPSSGPTASGNYSHAEGANTLASGEASHAEGRETTASGYLGSHAEGYQTEASSNSSHAEGFSTLASGDQSHAEGRNTTASGDFGSHAEGFNTNATGEASHAEGQSSTASGNISHAGGIENEAFSYSERAIGMFGTEYIPNSTTSFDNVDRLFNIGNGTSTSNRSDALTVLKDGDVGVGINNFEAATTGNKLQVSGTVYSEQYRLSALNTAPSSASDTGTLGEIRVTADYIYICTATDTWVRSALATWV